MCNHCYHAFGRKKMATMCEHTDRQAYADKMCMYCYQKKQRLRRRLEKNQAPQHLIKPKKRI